MHSTPEHVFLLCAIICGTLFVYSLLLSLFSIIVKHAVVGWILWLAIRLMTEKPWTLRWVKNTVKLGQWIQLLCHLSTTWLTILQLLRKHRNVMNTIKLGQWIQLCHRIAAHLPLSERGSKCSTNVYQSQRRERLQYKLSILTLSERVCGWLCG